MKKFLIILTAAALTSNTLFAAAPNPSLSNQIIDNSIFNGIIDQVVTNTNYLFISGELGDGNIFQDKILIGDKNTLVTQDVIELSTNNGVNTFDPQKIIATDTHLYVGSEDAFRIYDLSTSGSASVALLAAASQQFQQDPTPQPEFIETEPRQAPIPPTIFLDVESEHWFFNYVNKLQKHSIVQGYEDNTFRPEKPVTRAEFLKMVIASYNMFNGATIPVTFAEAEKPFLDVETNAWYYKYVRAGKNEGLVKGYEDGTFGPEDAITRAEAIKILSEITDQSLLTSKESSFPDVNQTDWFFRYVEVAKANNWVQGYEDNTFRPNNQITRAEAAKIIVEALQIN